MVDAYAYVGLDFRGDPDLVLPQGFQWGDLGNKKKKNYNVFVNFEI